MQLGPICRTRGAGEGWWGRSEGEGVGRVRVRVRGGIGGRGGWRGRGRESGGERGRAAVRDEGREGVLSEKECSFGFRGSSHPTLGPSPSRGGRRQPQCRRSASPSPCGEGARVGDVGADIGAVDTLSRPPSSREVPLHSWVKSRRHHSYGLAPGEPVQSMLSAGWGSGFGRLPGRGRGLPRLRVPCRRAARCWRRFSPCRPGRLFSRALGCVRARCRARSW